MITLPLLPTDALLEELAAYHPRAAGLTSRRVPRRPGHSAAPVPGMVLPTSTRRRDGYLISTTHTDKEPPP